MRYLLLLSFFMCPLWSAIEEVYQYTGSDSLPNPGPGSWTWPPRAVFFDFSGTVQNPQVYLLDSLFHTSGTFGGLSTTSFQGGGYWYGGGPVPVYTYGIILPHGPKVISSAAYTIVNGLAVVGAGNLNRVRIPYSFSWDSTIAGNYNPRHSYFVEVRGTVQAASIQLNTAGRHDLRPGWYHDFMSDADGNGVPDSFVRGNAGYVLQKQTFPDGSPIITLTSSDSSIAVIEPGGRMLRAVSPGMCEVTATCDGISVTVPFTVLAGVYVKRGVLQIFDKPTFALGLGTPFDPNPTTSVINVASRIFAPSTTPTTITVASAIGGTATVLHPGAVWGSPEWGQISIATNGNMAGAFSINVSDNVGQTSGWQALYWVRVRIPKAPGGADAWFDPDLALFRLAGDPEALRALGYVKEAPRVSPDPVIYATGEGQMWEDDLDALPGMLPWRRSYSNLMTYSDGPLGRSWMVDSMPTLARVGNYMVVNLRADAPVTFTINGGLYAALRDHPGILKASGSDLLYADASGMRILFHGLSATPLALRGRAKSLFTPGGDRIDYLYNAQGRLESISRRVSAGVYDELRFFYAEYDLMERVERHKVSGSTSSLTQAVRYIYYTGAASQHGDWSCLKAAQVLDPQGAIIRENLYRYYRYPNGSGYIPAPLRLAIGPRNCARLRAAGQDPLTTTWSDAQLEAYTDKAFTYDAINRITQQVLRTADVEGSGTYTYAYFARSDAPTDPGPNDWVIRTIETLPDGAQNIVYCNLNGQMLLRAKRASASATVQWVEAWRYTAQWRVEWEIAPDAFQPVAGAWYDEANTDLIALGGGNSPFIKDNAGAIRRYVYYASTNLASGAVAGYPQHEYDQVGDQGPLILRKTMTYTGRTQ